MSMFGANDRQGMSEDKTPKVVRGNAVVSWVMARVDHGREQRDLRFQSRWEEYTRLWRGMWDSADKNTNSERSKLIAPALSQSIEMQVAELEESVFGREAWFGTEDDDNAPEDVLKVRDNLLWDFDTMAVEQSIAQVFLLGAIYGTGIAKIHMVKHRMQVQGADGQPSFIEVPRLKVEAIRPDEFVIDPAATSIDEAGYCAHEVIKPRHMILEKQAQGLYRDGHVGNYNDRRYANTTGGNSRSTQDEDNAVLLTEFYGKVPKRLIKGSEGEAGMVEAIVTIANGTTLLKLVENPFTMKDRPIVAYQHDCVPGEFWGRGVAEKGYNPQKALDAELRARMDAMALMTAPMMGADLTRLGDRYSEFTVRPGKTVFTRGRPSEIYEPVAFGNPAQLGATFQHTGDLERMVQMGTGSMDSATPVGINRRNETVGGMSQLASGSLKRTKRTLSNIERQFLDPLIRKCLWRYMQFDSQRYPADYEFRVHGTMGLMAKEVENQQLTQVLGMLPENSPAQGVVIAALLENTVSAEKEAIRRAVAELNKPPSEEEQQLQQKMKQIQLQMVEAEAALKKAEVEREQAETLLTQEKARHERIKADLEDDLVEIQAANAATAAQKTRVAEAQVAIAHERNLVDKEKNDKQAASKKE